MGLQVQKIRFDDAPPSPERVRAQLAATIGGNVNLVTHPSGFHLIVSGLNVVVLQRGADLEILLRGFGRISRGHLGRTAVVRRALISLGGVTVPASCGRLRFRFAGDAPGIEQLVQSVAKARGKRRESFYRFGESFELDSPAGRATLQYASSGTVEVEALLSGRLFPLVVDALVALGGVPVK